MFSWLLTLPTTYFGFLSGIFMSLATTSLANFALAADVPKNQSTLIATALFSFGAASSWFLLSECISAAKTKIASNAEGIAGAKEEARQKALEVVRKDDGWRITVLALGAIACSAAWPFF